MTEEENDYNDDEDAGKIHLVIGLAVPVGSHVGILYSLQMINLFSLTSFTLLLLNKKPKHLCSLCFVVIYIAHLV